MLNKPMVNKANVFIIVIATIVILGIVAFGDISGMASKTIGIAGCRLSTCSDVKLYWDGVHKQSTKYNCGTQVVGLKAPIGRNSLTLNVFKTQTQSGSTARRVIQRDYPLTTGNTVDVGEMRVTLKGIEKNRPIWNKDIITLRICPPKK